MLLTINQLIDKLTPKAAAGDIIAREKINKLRQYKLKHPYSGRLPIETTPKN